MDRDPFAEGVDAFHAGKSEADNPYDVDTDADAHMSWNDGWNSGADMDDENLD